MSKIVGAVWTKQINRLLITCSCGVTFEHPPKSGTPPLGDAYPVYLAKWWAVCPECGQKEHLGKLREEYEPAKT